ncbi:hypothetical protein DFH08DRAFT_705089 [Mycena albidolilacea]|uniref:F-box domain-containing protein n=1 Tax=Mycena albidolilacea TaxID=1033008 RepID=A0AAD6ZUQ8_9AGAR|nr:hypothetical protein DFH08DRAFT_705089 [Mycena albidolilacea]
MAPCNSCGTGFSSSLLPNAAQIAQLRDILRSNTVPLDVSTFGGTISAAPAELDRYDAEITRLEYHLKRLASERQSLVSSTDGCQSIFSPVRRLPAEILAQIFDMCSPIDIYHVSRHTTPQQEVSSSWYHVAMETPKLWSTIVVDTSLWDDCAPAAHTLLSLLEASLNKGGNHPLFVQVYCSEFDFHQHQENPKWPHRRKVGYGVLWGAMGCYGVL